MPYVNFDKDQGHNHLPLTWGGRKMRPRVNTPGHYFSKVLGRGPGSTLPVKKSLVICPSPSDEVLFVRMASSNRFLTRSPSSLSCASDNWTRSFLAIRAVVGMSHT